MSLKKQLHKRIKMLGYCPYNEALSICLSLGRKPSNMERRLRFSESPEIQTVYNEKGQIIGYKWIGNGQLVFA